MWIHRKAYQLWRRIMRRNPYMRDFKTNEQLARAAPTTATPKFEIPVNSDESERQRIRDLVAKEWSWIYPVTTKELAREILENVMAMERMKDRSDIVPYICKLARFYHVAKEREGK